MVGHVAGRRSGFGFFSARGGEEEKGRGMGGRETVDGGSTVVCLKIGDFPLPPPDHLRLLLFPISNIFPFFPVKAM